MKCVDPSELVTLPEVKRRGVPGRPFRRAVVRGEIRVFDLGGWPRVRWSDVLEWVEGKRRLVGDRAPGTNHGRDRG